MGAAGDMLMAALLSLLHHYARAFGPLPPMRIARTGCGTGKRDYPAANIVRAMLGEAL